MAEEKVRRSLLLKTALEILRDAGTKMHPSQVLEEIQRRVDLNSRELSKDKSGAPRFDRAVGFDTGFVATVGWISKIGGWSITDAALRPWKRIRSPMSCRRNSTASTERLISVASRRCKR